MIKVFVFYISIYKPYCLWNGNMYYTRYINSYRLDILFYIVMWFYKRIFYSKYLSRKIEKKATKNTWEQRTVSTLLFLRRWLCTGTWNQTFFLFYLYLHKFQKCSFERFLARTNRLWLPFGLGISHPESESEPRDWDVPFLLMVGWSMWPGETTRPSPRSDATTRAFFMTQHCPNFSMVFQK